MKTIIFQSKRISEKIDIILYFINLFNVWLNGRQTFVFVFIFICCDTTQHRDSRKCHCIVRRE